MTSILKIEDRRHRHQDTQDVINALLRFSLQDISLDEYLRKILEHLTSIDWLSLQNKGAVFLVEKDKEMLVMQAEHCFPVTLLQKCRTVPLGRCLCGRAALEKKVQFAHCLDERHETRYEGMLPHGHYCVPIIYAGNVLGVINLYVKEGHARNQNEENFLNAAADTLAGVIIRKQSEDAMKRSMDILHRTLDGAVSAIGLITEQRDPYTAGHQQRVAKIAEAIALSMGLSELQINAIRVAAKLHDIGKISIPLVVLVKPSKLTNLEIAIIKCHPQDGYNILKTIPFSGPIAEIVLQHHERIDGSGYPTGLEGKDILLESKIIAVADVVEAMSSHRPYRPALGGDETLSEVKKNRGILYDPDVVDAWLACHHRQALEKWDWLI
jgi:putative nucleotidyltransferase with HDIG domain